MANSTDLVRANEGADSWNKWARAEVDAGRKPSVDFSNVDGGLPSFQDFLFPGDVSFLSAHVRSAAIFDNAKFLGAVVFEDATIDSRATFASAVFAGEANFKRVTFRTNASFDNATFSARSWFQSSSFQGVTRFQGATFTESTDFNLVKFERGARFSGATFCDEARFIETTFSSNARFYQTSFYQDSFFRGAKFDGRVNNFSEALFHRVPDFRITSFLIAPNFHDAKFNYQTNEAAPWWRRVLRCAAHSEDAARFRRLRQLAAEGKDHERELAFFAEELRAKRFYETTGFWPIALNVAYEWTSSFGRSISRPIFSLAILTALAWTAIAENGWTLGSEHEEKLGASIVLATTNGLLLLGADKWQLRQQALELAYGNTTSSFSMLGSTLAYMQSAISLALIFLMGLALRNRFRIGSQN